jgi:hypothetical protein
MHKRPRISVATLNKGAAVKLGAYLQDSYPRLIFLLFVDSFPLNP